MYKNIQIKLADDTPIVPIFQGKLYVASKDTVGGIVLDPLMLLRYYLIYKQVGS